jgi:hypothetical protein
MGLNLVVVDPATGSVIDTALISPQNHKKSRSSTGFFHVIDRRFAAVTEFQPVDTGCPQICHTGETDNPRRDRSPLLNCGNYPYKYD